MVVQVSMGKPCPCAGWLTGDSFRCRTRLGILDVLNVNTWGIKKFVLSRENLAQVPSSTKGPKNSSESFFYANECIVINPFSHERYVWKTFHCFQCLPHINWQLGHVYLAFE